MHFINSIFSLLFTYRFNVFINFDEQSINYFNVAKKIKELYESKKKRKKNGEKGCEILKISTVNESHLKLKRHFERDKVKVTFA